MSVVSEAKYTFRLFAEKLTLALPLRHHALPHPQANMVVLVRMCRMEATWSSSPKRHVENRGEPARSSSSAPTFASLALRTAHHGITPHSGDF